MAWYYEMLIVIGFIGLLVGGGTFAVWLACHHIIKNVARENDITYEQAVNLINRK